MTGLTELNAYIWDLDGTLFDSYGSIVSSLSDVAAQYRIPDASADILKAVKQESVSAYLRGLSARCGADTGTLYSLYREISHNRTEGITLIPGAAETLIALAQAGARHFVYTHRGQSSRPLLDRLGLTAFFEEIVTSENGFRPKPSGEGVEYLVAKYGLDKALTAYVGDRTLDTACAKNAGVKAVLYLPEDSCVEPAGNEDFIIANLTELVG